MNVGEEGFLEVGGGHVVVGVGKGEHVFEHAAGGARGRHKLHYAVASLLCVGIPSLEVGGLCLGVGLHNALAYAGGSVQLEIGEA